MPATALATARAARKRREGPAPDAPLKVVSATAKAGKVKPATDPYAQRYANCRVLGHEWHHVGRADNTDRAPTFGAFGWVSACGECGMRRVRWFARSGMIAGHPHYSPPEGYSRKGDDVLSMQEWRRTWINALGLDA